MVVAAHIDFQKKKLIVKNKVICGLRYQCIIIENVGPLQEARALYQQSNEWSGYLYSDLQLYSILKKQFSV